MAGTFDAARRGRGAECDAGRVREGKSFSGCLASRTALVVGLQPANPRQGPRHLSSIGALPRRSAAVACHSCFGVAGSDGDAVWGCGIDAFEVVGGE